jgi:hypothetical protein
MRFSLEEQQEPSMTRADVHHIYSRPESYRQSLSESDAHLAPSPCVLASAMHFLFPPSLHAAHDGAAANVHARPWCLSPPFPPVQYMSYGTALNPGPGPGEAEQAISCQRQPPQPHGTARAGGSGRAQSRAQVRIIAPVYSTLRNGSIRTLCNTGCALKITCGRGTRIKDTQE